MIDIISRYKVFVHGLSIDLLYPYLSNVQSCGARGWFKDTSDPSLIQPNLNQFKPIFQPMFIQFTSDDDFSGGSNPAAGSVTWPA